MELIDKANLVAKVEKLQSEIAEEKKLHEDNSMWYNGINHGFNLTKDILNSLKVKDVDLDKYINKYFKGWYVDLTDQGNILHSPDGQAGLMSVKKVAKHFFELGMAACNKTQKGEEV